MADRSYIESDLKQIGENYGSLSKNDLFPLWIVSLFHHGGDLSESTLDDIYQNTHSLLEEGGPGDNKLDGYYFDKNENTLYLYQTKWPDKPDKIASASDVEEVATALNILQSLSEEESEQPEPWQNVINAFKYVFKENGRIITRGVTSGRWGSKQHERLAKAIPSSLKDMVTTELYGLKDLDITIKEQSGDLKGEKVTVNLFDDTTDASLLVPNMGVAGMHESAVTLLSAKKLSEIAKKFKHSLFDRNVRLYLGSGSRNKDVFNQIITSDETRKSFWYGHNGITILCDNFKLIPNKEIPKTISIENPQVVNGCQTVNTLSIAFSPKGIEPDNACDFPILARIIKISGDSDLRDSASGLIAFATNNQTQVHDADLKSNDPKQKQLQEKLKKFDKKWFYERKRGEWKNLVGHKQAKFKTSKQDVRLIDKDLYQQSWRAFTGTPSAAISKKNDVWVRLHGQGNDLYDEIFGDHIRPCDVVLACSLFNWFKPVFKVDMASDSALCLDISKGLKKHLEKIRRSHNLVVTHSIAMFGYLVNKAYGDYNKYNDQHIIKLINKLDRKNYVKNNWSGESWKPLKNSMKLIFNAWYIYCEKLGDESLLTSLRKKDEEALKELIELMEDNNDFEYIDLVTPK
jgi:AIPR protein